ncbi:uncharacterized protein (DUF849 family) [Kribbella sp. VKM Ac-2568]|nr:uncharacterized protein (DUF849 family) [Kribbella sp. VKM Ac-2568]
MFPSRLHPLRQPTLNRFTPSIWQAGDTMTLKACLNGDRSRADHPAVPVTPAELAEGAHSAASAGAEAVHFHPRGQDERESLAWRDIQPAVAAVRERCPGLPLGVATREEIVPDLPTRLSLLSEWETGPDFASVNWHEEGAEQVAELLLKRGIGIEAGLFTPAAARKFLTWQGPIVRVLVEALPGISPGDDGISAARAILGELPDTFDLVVHGENEWAWPVLEWARGERYGLRAGFEDMLAGPGGKQVRSIGELVDFMRGKR